MLLHSNFQNVILLDLWIFVVAVVVVVIITDSYLLLLTMHIRWKANRVEGALNG